MFLASELDFEGENCGHLFSTPSHESSMSNDANILFEIRHSCRDDFGYQSITVLRQLRTDIK